MTSWSRPFRNCLVILLALALSVPIVQVLGPTENAEAAGPTSTLRIGFLQKIDSLNPYIGVSDAAYVFYGLVYDTLTCVDNKLNLSPNLAMSTWAVPLTDPEMIASGLPYGSLWQYNLTQNATWSDGVPFTADDVVWSVNLNAQYYDYLWAYQPYTYFIENATKVDDKTVRIQFYDRGTGDPCPAAYGNALSMFMLPRHKLISYDPATLGFTWTGVYSNTTPCIIGTGPFIPTDSVYGDWLSGDPITLVKNPNYHFGPDFGKYVNFDEVRLVFYNDALAMRYAIRNNMLDVAQFPPAAYYQIEQDVEDGTATNIQTYDGLKATQYWTEIGICQNSGGGSNPSRCDPVIRHALAQAVNKTYVVENFYLGLAAPGSTIISPMNAFWHYEPTAEHTWDYDLAAAAALLENNGYRDTDADGIREATSTSPAAVSNLVPDGFPLSYEMLVRAEYPEEKEIALYLQEQWMSIGVEIQIKVVDEPTLNTIVYSYNYDMMIWYWSSDVDPNYQLFTLSTMSINGWNDVFYSNAAYDENYTDSVKAMDKDQRQQYVYNCQKIMYYDCAYILLAYPYQTYAWRTDTFAGWGDWAANPGRSLDNFWSANPLWFDLVPMWNVTGPTNLSLIAAPSQSSVNSPVTFQASATPPGGFALRFTIDFGDGNIEVRDTPMISDPWTETFYHSYAASSEYTATLWVWDGLSGAEHNVSTSTTVTVIPGPQRNVEYEWYDMFNVPFGSWWDRRWNVTSVERPWSRSYPYIFEWHGPPVGNTKYYTNMRLNVTGASMPEINTDTRPEFLPFLGSERGGNAVIDWHMQYMTHDELVDLVPLAASWDDGWFLRMTGTTVLDEQGAKSVLGLTSDGYNDFSSWWSVNNATKSQEYRNWLLYEANTRLDIYPMYEYPLTFIMWNFWAEKENNSIVLHYDYITWGMEALMTRWLHDAFMPTEWYFEDFEMHAEIGPDQSDLDINTVVVYAAYAWENRTTGEPCWVWEAMLQDTVASSVPHTHSDFDPYIPHQYRNRAPGSSYHGLMMQYDYTPGAWNLSEGETLSFQWPEGPQLFIRHVSTGVTANETGNMSVGYAEPSGADFPTKVLLNPGANKITYVGPIDMWTWSKDQAAHPDLASEWDRLGMLPYGIPWIEFQNLSRAGPNAAFSVTPSQGNSSTIFFFNASATTDPDNPTGTLEFRWDFESDGVWDTGWSSVWTAGHVYPTGGLKTALLEVRNNLGLVSSAVANVYVVGRPPVAGFTVNTHLGGTATIFTVDASPSSDPEDPPWALMVRWRWDYGGQWTSWTTNKTSTHSYSVLGYHVITLQVKDTSGSVAFATDTVGVYDDECPFTDITVAGTAGGGGWYVTDTEFEFSAVDNLSAVYATHYRIDGGNWLLFDGTPCTVSDGGHVIEYYSTDDAGNNETVKSAAINVDKAAPWLHGSISSGTMGQQGWYVTRPTIDFGAVDDNSSGIAEIRYLLFGVQWKVYSTPFVLQETGTMLLQIEATDVAGNEMAAKQVVIKVDPYAPVVSVGSQETYSKDTVTVTWGVSENLSGVSRVETSIDAGSFQSQGTGSEQIFAGLKDGTHTLVVRAYDNAGNVGEKTVTFTVDTGGAGTSALTIALIGVAVVAAIAAVLLLLMRRKWKPEPPAPQ